MFEVGIIKQNEKAIDMYGDNQSALRLSDSGKREKSRHYAGTMFYVKDFVKRKEVLLNEVRSAANPADIFRKFSDYSNYKPICKIIKLVDARKIYSNRP